MNISRTVNTRRYGTTSEEIVSRLYELIQRGNLSNGYKLPPERDLANLLGVSRLAVRDGIRSLSVVGVLRSRRGAGTFVVEADESPTLDGSALRLIADLNRFAPTEMFEARIALEMCITGLAAERATVQQMILMAEEIAGMFASFGEPEQFLAHDIQFHKIIAAASNNRILTALVNMITQILFETQSKIVYRAQDLKESAATHRRIYRAIRKRDIKAAREAMREHLLRMQKAQQNEQL